MPHVMSRGQSIHYTLQGNGPLVILQHGMLGNGGSWEQVGFVAALSDKYRVACVDSLGHGLSDKPPEASLYTSEQRAGDLIAVMDDLGYERAHLAGYSMGGWMSVAVARFYPMRLASLAIGGWDIIGGLESTSPIELKNFDSLMDAARAAAPELFAWATPAVEPGLKACFDALSELDGAGAAVSALKVPVQLWCGRDDPYYEPMKSYAAVSSISFVTVPGDHVGAIKAHGPEAAKHLRAFLDTV